MLISISSWHGTVSLTRTFYILTRRGMEENGSEGVFEVIQTEAAEGKFLYDVDFFCISVREDE
jgi:hypothetical protein